MDGCTRLSKSWSQLARVLKRFAKLLENDPVGFVHMSLVELIEDDCYLWDNEPLDLKLAEVLELIHTKEGYHCDNPEEDRCKRQREKLKKKP